MTSAVADSSLPKPLRLWPGVLILAIQWIARFVIPLIAPDATPIALLGGAAGGLGILIWWLFFSRAPKWERIGTVLVMIAALLIVSRLVHISIAKGAMGFLFPMFAVPTLSLTFILWAAARKELSPKMRWTTMILAIFLGCGVWTLARTGGFTSGFRHDLMWRWEQDHEEKLLARTAAGHVAKEVPKSPDPAVPAVVPVGVGNSPAVKPVPEAATTTPAVSWPGFRGQNRDGIVSGIRIDTDWATTPPVEMWRRDVGPGWSSFAIDGDRLYTQEQRGDSEIVAAYSASTGSPVWMHRDSVRFWESNAGAGPRGTPALSNGRVYTLGGTGVVNALDARDGAVIWSRNAAADSETKLPEWGYSGSPLVVDDSVIVAASGRLVAYQLDTGKIRWLSPQGGASYSSPHLATVGGVRQILLVDGTGVSGISPAEGTPLWRHEWKGFPIVQPALTPEGDLLVSVNESSGIRRLSVAKGDDGWTVAERWTTNGLKPFFNDFVVHKGHAFGFDGAILSCIDLANGKRKWKGGRYGQGQLILLPDQDLLLVLSEEGELALVKAATDQYAEVARRPAIEGKTWNHPVLAGNALFVRNSTEMAAFRLNLAGR